MELDFFFHRTDNDNRLCNASDASVSEQTVTTSLLLCVFVGSLSILVTCGNLLVIIAIIYFKQLHTPTNYLILSLAMADLLVGVIVLPFSTMLSVSSCWYLSFLLCKIRGTFDVFLSTCSILNLCFISVDRYYVVCKPLIYRTKMNVHIAAIMILVTWTVTALLGVGITVRDLNQQQVNTRCKIFQNTKSAVIGTIFGFYMPAFVILLIYIKILFVALKQARSIHNATKFGESVSRIERKATKTLAIVVGIFLFCWSPYFLCMAFYPLSKNKIPVSMIEAFKWFGWSNSMLNPFVYGFFYKWFRRAFKMIISGKIFKGDFSNSKLF